MPKTYDLANDLTRLHGNDLELVLKKLSPDTLSEIHDALLSVSAAVDISDHARDIVPLQERESFAERKITLNGQAARVCNIRNRFALIHTIDSAGPSADFSWQAVKHIIENKGGAFRV